MKKNDKDKKNHLGRSDQSLASKNVLIKAVLDAHQDIFFLFDPYIGRAVLWNKALAEITGYTDEEISSMKVPDVYCSHKDLQRVALFFNDFLLTKKGRGTIVFPLICKNGHTIPTECTASLLRDSNNKPRYVIVIGRNITEREKAKKELHSAVLFLDTVLDMSPFPMWISDKAGTMIRTNRSLRDTVHLTDDQLVGKYNVFKDKNLVKQGMMPQVEAVFKKAEAARFSIPWRAAEINGVDFEGGRNMYIDVSMFPILDDGGKLTNVVCQWVDITEHKKAEEDLKAAKERAEQLNETKTEFLMNVSHDIRTPMNVISGFTELLLKSQLNQQQSNFCSAIKRKGQDLLHLIEDIIDISAFEKGVVRIHNSPFSFQDLIEDVRETIEAQIVDKEILFKCQIEEEVPSKIMGDSMRLKQILENLCGNAVKYTDKGTISLTVSADKKTHEESIRTVRFVVEDTGKGITAAQLPRIFEPYSRFYEISTNKEQEGVGMGLHIVEALAREMDGEVTAESELGKGSKFTVKLHMKELREEEDISCDITPAEPKNETSLDGIAILIAEDDEDSRYLMSQALKETGCNVQFAHNGEEVLEKVKQNKYDVVIMDIRMPRMDGFQAAEAIRKDIDPNIPILALTAHAGEWVEGRCREVGMNGCITKPINIDTLKRLISENLK